MANTPTPWSNTVKFPDGNECQIGDKLVGLRNGGNYNFNFPSDGIKDGNGNYLMKWATVGGNAINWLKLSNSSAGLAVSAEAEGSDTNIDIDITPKGTGKVDVGGLFTVNGSTNINSIIDDDTMASASDTNVPTSESVVNYLTSQLNVVQTVVTESTVDDSTTATALSATSLTGSIIPTDAANRIMVWCFGGGISDNPSAINVTNRSAFFDIQRTSGTPTSILPLAARGRNLAAASTANALSYINVSFFGTEIAGDTTQHDYVLRFGAPVANIRVRLLGSASPINMIIMEVTV